MYLFITEMDLMGRGDSGEIEKGKTWRRVIEEL